jgi:hypothetical protein
MLGKGVESEAGISCLVDAFEQAISLSSRIPFLRELSDRPNRDDLFHASSVRLCGSVTQHPDISTLAVLGSK